MCTTNCQRVRYSDVRNCHDKSSYWMCIEHVLYILDVYRTDVHIITLDVYDTCVMCDDM